MSRLLLRFACVGSFVFGTAAIPHGLTAADDTKAPAKDVPTKAPDWSKYVYVKEFTGEIQKADDKKVTVRVKWTAPKGNPVKGRPPQVQEQHKDYDYDFLPESLVRYKTLPPKTDDKGKNVPYTQKEKEALKVPTGVVGYVASHEDLKPGTLVDVILIRDRSIPADKLTDSDSKIKYVVIQPPATTTTTSPNK